MPLIDRQPLTEKLTRGEVTEVTPGGVGLSRHFLRGSILLLGLRVFWWMFTVDALYAGILYFFMQYGLNISESVTFTILWVLHLAKFLLLLWVVLKLSMDWATRTYYLAGHHLVRYHGILEVDEAIYELQSLKSLHLKESIIGRLLNYGDIYLTLSSSGYREDVVLRGISHARRYERVLRDYLEQNAGQATPLELEPGVIRQ